MEHCEIILPISILVLAFLFKLFVDRNADAPLIIKSTFELPVDIIFLTISFLAAFAIGKKTDNSEELTTLVIFIIVALINVLLFRRAITLFECGKKGLSLIPTSINYISSIYCLIITINTLI